MKKLFLLAALVIASAATSFAEVSFGGGAHTGLAFTSFPRPLTDLYGVGFGGGAHGDLNILPALAVRLSFDYNGFASDKARLKELFAVRDENGNPTNDFSVEGANVNIIGVMAHVIGKIPTGSIVRPYGVVGFGLQFFSQSNLQVMYRGRSLLSLNGAAGTTNFGLNFGAGTEFGLTRRTSLFIEAKYDLIFTSGSTSSYVPLTVGVSF